MTDVSRIDRGGRRNGITCVPSTDALRRAQRELLDIYEPLAQPLIRRGLVRGELGYDLRS